LPDDLDERRKEMLLGALLIGAGVICFVAIFVGQVRFGALLAKIGGGLLVYGCLKLSRSLKAPATQSGANDSVIVPAAGVQLIPMLTGRVAPMQAQLMSPWNRFCVIFGCAGTAVLLFSLLSFFVTIVLFQLQRTVVLTGVPSFSSGYGLIVAAGFSLLVGISWSSLAGGANRAVIALRGVLLGLFVSLPILMVPLLITSDQLAQAATFAGNTAMSSQLYRIESARATHGRSGVRYDATIDPYHYVDRMKPSVPIDERAYRQINASKISVPFGPEYPGWPGRRSTSLCLRAAVEHAGIAERILLRGPLTTSDMVPCPPGTPT